MQNEIRQKILNALIELNLPEVEFAVEHPTIESHGDYATNVAMVLFPTLKKQGITTYSNPRELAQVIANKVNGVVAGPGFINFTISRENLITSLHQILDQKENFGKSNLFEGKKIVVEYTDPNPFKEFHIGHLYSNIVGESISRLMEANGATVWRADYFGDVGMHVSKSIWGLLQKFSEEQTSLETLSTYSLNDRIKYLGQAYAKGASAYEEIESAKEDMKDLNYIVYVVAQRFITEQRGRAPMVNYQQFIYGNKYDQEQIFTIYKTCRTWSLEYFETIYARLGTKFNGYYPESIVGEYGYQTVQEHLGDVFEKGDKGAIIFPGSKYGLHDRVFINSFGLPTYECKELGLAPTKYEDFPYDKSIIVTGNEINAYFDVLIKAMTLTLPTLGSITTHIGHGMVRLPEGKMSSRTGKVLTGEWLLDEAKHAAINIIDELNPNLEQKENVADQIGIAAIRYALLKTNIGKDVIFNFAQSVNFAGDSGPYIQYTYARCNSVIQKATGDQQPSTTINPEELSLIRWLMRYPEILVDAAEQLTPHLIAEYVFELSQRFNTFYNKHTILGNELRLNLTKATAQVLQNGLHILGIQTPERM